MITVRTDYNEYLDRNRKRSEIGQIGDYQSIYKYVSLNNKTSWNYLEETILESKIIGSTAASLNDPFELSPYRLNDLDEKSIMDAHRFYGIGENLVDKWNEDLENQDRAYFVSKSNSALDNTIANSRMVSFCDKIDSPLLWAHYANSHQGACLHFVGRAFNYGKYRKGLVSYSRQRPTMPISLVLKLLNATKKEAHQDQRAKLITALDRALFFTKPIDWEYEGEYRVIYSTTVQTNIKFDPTGFLEIVAGCKMPDDDFEEIRKIVSRSKNKLLKIRRTEMSDRTFSVNISK